MDDNIQKTEVTLVFDIGKTNKKILLFDQNLKVQFQEESKFNELIDDDGFPCDDIAKIEQWINQKLSELLKSDKYLVTGINFTSYGATLVYLGRKGNRLTPVYNYLKPLEINVDTSLYEKYGGRPEFLRKTASPALKMLNSGLQILYLKQIKPKLFNKVHSILHFPQYLSYLLTGKITSEATSIGCHTAMWDFDKMKYHQWLVDEKITLPKPEDLSIAIKTQIGNQTIDIGIGIHDSSASLVPYLMASDKNFVLISTGTWCINMNPFNHTPLTKHELEKECLNYITYEQKPVKSSRVFLGRIHDENVKELAGYFNISLDSGKITKFNKALLYNLYYRHKGGKVFFKEGIPDNYIDTSINYTDFTNFEHAYHQLIIDLALIVAESIRLIISGKDNIEQLYITGGFARNKIFTAMLATIFNNKLVYTSQIDNATALGAALVINNKINRNINLGLRQIKSIL